MNVFQTAGNIGIGSHMLR